MHNRGSVTRRRAGGAALLIGFLGVAATLFWLSGRTVNPVTYEVTKLQVPGSPGATVPGPVRSLLIPLIALAAIAGLVVQRRKVLHRSADVTGDEVPAPRETFGRAAVPLAMTFVAGLLWVTEATSDIVRHAGQADGAFSTWIGEVFPFALFCITVIGVGWCVARLGEGLPLPGWFQRLDRFAPALVVIAVVASTVFHALEQVHFWRHFLLGYADFGLFTTELEHCLPFKDVGAARFVDTRMGYHCVPMFYLLAPLYAVFRAPAFLMVVGPLALNLAAIPFYQLARERTGVPTVGLVVAVAYLALPSLSRLPYSNTYGFQSIYLAVPWLAFAFRYGAVPGRWRWSHFCLAGAMLCEETVCGVAFGWGVYLALFGKRRRDGMIIALLSILYLLFCTTIVIPAFAQSSDYTRLMLFGDLTVQTAIERLSRPRVLLFLMALGAPLLLGLTRSVKPLIIVLPSLFLVVLLQQTDYLNLKYWHHTSILVALFFTAVLGVTSWRRGAERLPGRPCGRAARPLGLLVTVLIFYQFLGHGPLTQSQRIYAAYPSLNKPDPRLGAVNYVRTNFALDRFTVIATERMAAHFTDYRMVYPAPGVRFSDTTTAPYVLVFDRSDRWDEIVMKDQAKAFLDRARRAGFVPVHKHGPVLILTNRPHHANVRKQEGNAGSA